MYTVCGNEKKSKIDVDGTVIFFALFMGSVVGLSGAHMSASLVSLTTDVTTFPPYCFTHMVSMWLHFLNDISVSHLRDCPHHPCPL